MIKDGYLVKTWGEVATHKWWASASKPVFSTLLLLAVHEGKLAGVDAPVKIAGWDFLPKDTPMTFRHLANMTSGYATTDAPGAAWGYNDFAIQLYARSLEKIFAQPLAEAFGARFAALQFEDGAFFALVATLRAGHPAGAATGMGKKGSGRRLKVRTKDFFGPGS